MSTQTDIKYRESSGTLTTSEPHCSILVWNDEVNTFDWVINALVEICGHTPEQAEQCAIIIDSKGKYAVKEGTYEVLKPMCDAITDRGIGATIEVMSD
jgi:ATP-dependent Clp protease adaptor protein ClpS